MNNKRVVVTGMGAISSMGLNTSTTWENLVAGQSGVGPITLFDTSDLEVTFAGEAHGFDPENYMSPKDARRMDRFSHFALAALQEAQAQSGLFLNDTNAYDVGVNVSTGVGGIGTYSSEFEVLTTKGPRRVSPFLVPSIIVDAASVQIALRSGAQGPNFGLASACATGADAIGIASELIRLGYARAMFTGSFEADITLIGVAAFTRMQALSKRNHDPQGASRPFDSERDGFVMAEGGALLVLEDLEYALMRGAEPLAEICGYASTSDAIHITSPDAEGMGAARCMSLAIERAGVSREDVSYINAHGTSTRLGDPAETRAIKQVFGERAYRIPVSSTKSMSGHLAGGAGSLEAAICILAIRHGMIPPTINLHNPDPDCDLDYVPLKARSADLNVVLSNSFGFGGHNSTLVITKYTE